MCSRKRRVLLILEPKVIFRQSPRKWSVARSSEDFALLGSGFVTTHESGSCFQLRFALPLSSARFNLLLGVNWRFYAFQCRGRRICRGTIIELAFLVVRRDYCHALTSKTNFSSLHGPRASTWLIRLLSLANRWLASSHHAATQSRD